MDFSAVIDILVSQEFARALIVAFFAAAICGIWLKPLPLRAIANSAPTILTSLGIFYTFLGILIALQDFDPNKPNTSMPELLKGLKLAFESSAWGLGLALGFRLVQAVGARESTAAPASAEALHSELRALNRNTLSVLEVLGGGEGASLCSQLKQLRNESKGYAEKADTAAENEEKALQGLDEELGMLNKNTLLVRQALTGEGDASLYAQLERLRSEFGDFAEKVAQNGTEALVEALSGVILDFNEKISEQFGDNFKQLNDAVGRLLDWQKEYTQQMEQLKKAFEENQESIHKVRISVEAIEKATGEIPEYISTLGVAFNNVHNHAEQLEQSFEALSDMREAAKKAIPSMEGVIQTMGNDLVAITEKFVEIYNKFEQAIATFSSRLIELEEQMMRRLDQDGREP